MKTYNSRKFMLLISLLMIAFSVHAAYVEIGTGTSSTNYAPFTGLWDYSWSRSVYLQSEIGMSMDISSLSYYVGSNPANFTIDNLSCYIKHTSDATFTSPAYIADPVAEGFQLCYTGSQTFNGGGWHEINLDTAFSYNGTDNLIIMWDSHDGSWASGGPSFLYTSAPERVVYDVQDSIYPAEDGTISDYLPNTRLHYELVGGPGEPTTPNPTDGLTDVSINLSNVSWTSGGNTTNYDVYFGTDYPPTTMIADNMAALASSVNLPATLEYGTTYYWKVIARNLVGEVSSPIWSFITEDETITTFPYETSFDTFPPTSWDLTGGIRNWAAYNSGDLHCAYANFWGWSTGECHMKTPSMVLPDAAMLSFSWSHFYNTSYPNDALTVQISTDGGENWTELWYRVGENFDSGDGAGNTSPGSFTQASVSLAAYAGQNVIVNFLGTSGYGPNVYLDDISFFSNNSAPNPVTLIAPADLETEVLVNGNLAWNGSGLATGFYLYFGTDNPPTNIVNGENQGTNTSYAFNGLTASTVYYWQVVPFNESGSATGCPIWSFTTQVLPTLSEEVYPVDNAIDIPLSFDLEWEASIGADGYKVFLGTDDPPTNIMNGDVIEDGLTAAVSGLAGETEYFWQVVPFNTNGDAIDAEIWSFTTYGAPDTTSVYAPANNATNRPETGALAWEPVSGADGYRVKFGTDNPPTTEYEVGTDTYFDFGVLEYSTTYYWQVMPYNEIGNAADCPIWNFTTTDTGTFTGTDGTYYFANSMADAVSKPTYQWVDFSGHTELPATPENGSVDDGNWLVDLPFSFPLYGADKNSMYVTTNGILMFTQSSPYSNAFIPNTSTPNEFIAIVWDDFQCYSTSDVHIYYGGDENSFTVTYWHLPRRNAADYYMTMQATLFPDGKIIMCYNADESTTMPWYYSGYTYSSTIGIENADGTVGVQYRAGFASSTSAMSEWVGGPIFDPINGDLALCFGTDMNDLNWPTGGLDAPTNVVITIDGNNANLTWEAVAGATEYEIYSSDTPNGTYSFVTVALDTTASVEIIDGAKFFYVVATDGTVRHAQAPVVRKQQATKNTATRTTDATRTSKKISK